MKTFTEISESLSKLIERKINKRNETAQQQPRPDKLVKFMDDEINDLEAIETYLVMMENNFRLRAAERYRKGFTDGQSSGRAECLTGRPHPMHLFT